MPINPTLLTQLCASLNNFFPPSAKKHSMEYIHHGEFTVRSGVIEGIDFIIPNQYFRIVGSVLNDGVYKNTAEDMSRLEDETFSGSVWEMAVPKSFIALCEDIQAFRDKVDEIGAKDSGFTSESFGGYSYSLSTSAPAYMQEWSGRIQRGLSSYRRMSVL